MFAENGKSIDAVLGRFLDGQIKPGDEAALAAALAKDERLTEELRRLLCLDDLLRQAAQPNPAAFVEALQTKLAAEKTARNAESASEPRPLGSGDADAPGPLPNGRGSEAVRRSFGTWFRLGLTAAALVLLALGVAWRLNSPSSAPSKEGPPPEVAWLSNAQNCRWTEKGAPEGDLSPGKMLELRQGLAELHFRSGACLVLQGPANLQLLSAGRVRLLRGKLTARVPESARGFEVLSPAGKVMDLGTEFGIGVEEDGSTQVYVFRGEVETQAAGGETLAGAIVKLKQQQSARIGAEGVLLNPAGLGTDSFVREIVPPPLVTARTLALDFRHAVPGTLPDRNRQGTGLTHRLPGTRHDLRIRDKNLHLNSEMGCLEMLVYDNDLDKQRKLYQGEYVGIRLSDLGFTGEEDFAVTAVIPNVPLLGGVGQLGLYAGTRSDKTIRGGLMRRWGSNGGYYNQFFVHNNGSRDSQLHTVGLASCGESIRLTLQRLGGKYSLTVENLTTGTSSTLSNRPPDFLDEERDLYVGVFAAAPWSKWWGTLRIKELKATIWTVVSGPNGQRAAPAGR
jgi:negative regulator of sigma E activity